MGQKKNRKRKKDKREANWKRGRLEKRRPDRKETKEKKTREKHPHNSATTVTAPLLCLYFVRIQVLCDFCQSEIESHTKYLQIYTLKTFLWRSWSL